MEGSDNPDEQQQGACDGLWQRQWATVVQWAAG
jgi:hypothetical protein